MKQEEKFNFIIDNYVNGNLKDFHEHYKKLRKKITFLEYLKLNYGESVFNKVMDFLKRKEM